MVAVCAKAGGCGVSAIGRCYMCGEAFCGSHQGWDVRTRLVDMCGSCAANKQARDRQRSSETVSSFSHEEVHRWLRDIARPTLLSSRSAPWEDLHEVTGSQKRRFRQQWDDVVELVGRGLVIETQLTWVGAESRGARVAVLTDRDIHGSPVVAVGPPSEDLKSRRVLPALRLDDNTHARMSLKYAVQDLMTKYAPR